MVNLWCIVGRCGKWEQLEGREGGRGWREAQLAYTMSVSGKWRKLTAGKAVFSTANILV